MRTAFEIRKYRNNVPFSHERAENLYYVLRGKALVELDGERILLKPHMGLFIPPGIKHGI